MTEEALVQEALRVNDRYLREVVVAHDFCPWAAKSLRDGHVLRRVLSAPAPDLAATLAFVDALEGDATMDIGLLIFPRATLAANLFDRFAESVRQADRRRRGRGNWPAFVLQAFHPFPETPRDTAHQFVSFIRRAPDATIQFVRYTTLEDARRNAPDISDQIAERNFAAARAQGVARLEAVLDDIRRDRDEAYARLL